MTLTFRQMLPWLAMVFVLAIHPSPAHATQLITNGDFETNDFTGWTEGISPDFASGGRPHFYDTFGNGWITSNTTQMFGLNFITPINGYSAFNGFDGTVMDGSNTILPEADLTFYLRQAITLDGPYASAILQYTFDIDGGPVTNFPGHATIEPRTFTTSITDLVMPSVLATVVVDAGPADLPSRVDIPRQTVTLDVTSLLNSLSPGTYYLQFDELIPQAGTGVASFVIDDVSLLVVPTPEPSSFLIAGLGALGVALFARRKRALAAGLTANSRSVGRGPFKLLAVAPFILLGACATPVAAETLFVDQMFGVSVTQNVQYGSNLDGSGNTVSLMLDLYQPTGPGLPAHSPAIVLMHGGSFVTGDKTDTHITRIAEAFAQRGYVAASIDYRLLELLSPPPGQSLTLHPERVPAWVPGALDVWGVNMQQFADTIAAAVEDQAMAVNWLVANAATYNVDPNMMAIGGYSAGAISSQLLGVGAVDGVDAPVRAVFSVAGGLFGWETAVDPSDPGFFIMHGTADDTVPFAEVGFLQDALAANGVPFDSKILPGVGHLGLTAIFLEDPAPVFEFMIGQLAVPEPDSSVLAGLGFLGLALLVRARRGRFH